MGLCEGNGGIQAGTDHDRPSAVLEISTMPGPWHRGVSPPTVMCRDPVMTDPNI